MTETYTRLTIETSDPAHEGVTQTVTIEIASSELNIDAALERLVKPALIGIGFSPSLVADALS